MSRIKKRLKSLLPDRLARLLGHCANYLTDGEYRRIARFRKDGTPFIPRLAEFPPMVLFETTTACNMACAHCPHTALSKDSRWGGEMDINLYRRLIDEIAAESPRTIVRPFNGGEPLMRPDIEDMIAYAKAKGIERVSLNTNGLLLDARRARSLLSSGLDSIAFSLDALTARTYRKIHASGRFLEVTGNIEAFLKLNRGLRRRVDTAVSFVKQKDNQDEEIGFKEYWARRVDSVIIRECHEHHGLVDPRARPRPAARAARYPCPYLWNRLIVRHDGKVSFCEMDWTGAHTVGDAAVKPLKEIWRDAPYSGLRKSHLARTFEHPFCAQCVDWDAVRW